MIIIVVFVVLMISICIFTYLKNKGIHISNKEFYLGCGKIGVFVLFFTFFATQYSGNMIVGYAPNAYRMGFMWLQSITFFILIVIGYLLFAPRLYVMSKKFNFITPSDFIEKRFNHKDVTSSEER